MSAASIPTTAAAADRTDQVASAALQRQRLGGIEKRRGDPQTHGIYAHRTQGASRFYQQHFNPYLNFHRPCGQPGEQRQRQAEAGRHYQTPWESFEKLLSSQGTRLRLWAALPRRKATLRRRAGCNKRTSCLPASRPPRRHANSRKRVVEMPDRGKPKPGFVFHRPWKSLRGNMRSIPARAGEPTCSALIPYARRVYRGKRTTVISCRCI